jgi:hypothetical protein
MHVACVEPCRERIMRQDTDFGSAQHHQVRMFEESQATLEERRQHWNSIEAEAQRLTTEGTAPDDESDTSVSSSPPKPQGGGAYDGLDGGGAGGGGDGGGGGGGGMHGSPRGGGWDEGRGEGGGGGWEGGGANMGPNVSNILRKLQGHDSS